MVQKIFAGFSLVLLCAALPVAVAAEPANPDRRSIHVSGQAQIQVVPDMATLQMGVDQVDAEIAAAEAHANQALSRFLKQARKLGIAERDLQAAGQQVSAEYEWLNEPRQRRLVGYRVSRDVAVIVRDLRQLGPVLQAATAAGLNRIGNPDLASGAAEALEKQALELAADDAKARANLVAQRLGARLGPVRNIHVQDQGNRPVPMKMMARMESASSDMPVAAGEISISATLQVEFELLEP